MFVLRRRQAAILDLSPDLHRSPDQQLHALLRRRDRVVRPQRAVAHSHHRHPHVRRHPQPESDPLLLLQRPHPSRNDRLHRRLPSQHRRERERESVTLTYRRLRARRRRVVVVVVVVVVIILRRRRRANPSPVSSRPQTPRDDERRRSTASGAVVVVVVGIEQTRVAIRRASPTVARRHPFIHPVATGTKNETARKHGTKKKRRHGQTVRARFSRAPRDAQRPSRVALRGRRRRARPLDDTRAMMTAATVATVATTRPAIAARPATRRAPRATPRALATPGRDARARGFARRARDVGDARATRDARDARWEKTWGYYHDRREREVRRTSARARREARGGDGATATAFVAVGWFELTRARGEGGTGTVDSSAKRGGRTEASRAKRRARRARTRERARVGRGGGSRIGCPGSPSTARTGPALGFSRGRSRAGSAGTIGCFRRDGRWRRGGGREDED